MDVYSVPSPPEAAPGAGPEALAIRTSIVIPVVNEADVLEKLHGRIGRVMKQVEGHYEVIFINDGSTDTSAEILEGLVRKDKRVVFIDLQRNFGKSMALQAGFDHARGEIIIMMDGDLQHDPYEIPFFISKIDEGYDIASGWRIRRRDSFIMRRVPSKIANLLLAAASGVKLHDFGTGFKAYRREVLEAVRLYGDMHRFIPAICAPLGAKICEVPIKNVRRPFGKSRYGIGRAFRVALDIITLRFVTTYLARPLHFFGKWAMLFALAGMGILAYGLGRKIYSGWEFHLFVEHGPLMALGFMLVAAGMLMLATGLIGELLMRIYFESTGARTYAVRRVVIREDAPQSRDRSEV